MASLPVYDRSGKEVGRYEIAATDLAPSINKQLLHDAVVMYQANQRQGTFRTKTRGEVAGSTKKMYRQKGTGNARAGSRRTNIRVGGGHAFAKRPRDFSYRLPRKALQLATRMAVASKIESNSVVVIDDIQLSAPKTKDMAGILKALQLEGQSTLVATNGYDVNVYKSTRNIDRVTISPVAELNALSVLKPKRLLVTRAALDALKNKTAVGRAS
jgi:large subunit ribosomal protein L4